MRPSLVCFAILLLFRELALATPATQPAIESKPVEMDGVSITVLMTQQTFSADEQPRIVIRFSNTSADYINLYDVKAFWDWSIQFTNIDKKAEDPGPWELAMNKIAFRYPIAHLQIKAGESLEVPIDLNDPPFTFKYVYAGIQKHLVAPVRHLKPGMYQVVTTIKLNNPFPTDKHMWVGPATTAAVQFNVSEPTTLATQPTTQETADYDAEIKKVIDTLVDTHGLWINGMSPNINFPANADADDVIAAAVNADTDASKAYRILRVQHLDHPQPDMSAALVRVGKQTRVLVFFPSGNNNWWTRFYDTIK